MSSELHIETQLDDLYIANTNGIFDNNMEIEQDLDVLFSKGCL